MHNNLIKEAEMLVRTQLGKDASGHDYHHCDRVRKLAIKIAIQEGITDTSIIELAALLHDVPDEKLNDGAEQGWRMLDEWFDGQEAPLEIRTQIKTIIQEVSYKGGHNSPPSSLEAEIVQDADRLEAIGAIGIARAFAYGGKKGRPLYDPSISVRDEMTLEEYRNANSTTIHHFYEKLLKLSALFNTGTGKEMAKKRHEYMESFLDQFYKEWDAEV
ncbi:HD domain-containing protein [Peribacillus alkalitolerans]|uniref:HD domain-containing protein n=1 Tax=Peribacillus alkalitolerans TaxID=1550385 RepID=UPI0013CF8552|nr:HD domain-containing protein [Peribacillus alkalitolerans]